VKFSNLEPCFLTHAQGWANARGLPGTHVLGGDTRVGHVPVGLLIHIETCIGQVMDMKDHDDDDSELGESIHEACTNMMTKWNKYFSTADHLNVVAHIIDLRFKLRL
jgi:hypothetical protein